MAGENLDVPEPRMCLFQRSLSNTHVRKHERTIVQKAYGSY
jgi:hypothetical protein